MAKHYIAVDVGGTKILATVVDDAGKVLLRHKEKTEQASQKKLLEQLDAAICMLAGQHGQPISGLVLGVPGVCDSRTGFVVNTPNAPLSQVPLAQIMARRFSWPVAVGNDVNLGVMGENWMGAARGASSAFGIFVGTGIGGGLVIEGKLIEGFRGMGGEIGHLMIPLGADEITGMLTKKHSFLEDLCSRTAIENQLRHAILDEGQKSILSEIVGDKKLRRIRSGALRDALKKGDELVTEVMRRASHLLGLAAASVFHIVDPEVIIFGGGVIEACGHWMLPLIEKTAQKVAIAGTGAEFRIVQSQLGDDAIVLGGVALLLQNQTAGPYQNPTQERLPFEPGRPVLAQVDKPLASV